MGLRRVPLRLSLGVKTTKVYRPLDVFPIARKFNVRAFEIGQNQGRAMREHMLDLGDRNAMLLALLTVAIVPCESSKIGPSHICS
jgi:hypothetical protein